VIRKKKFIINNGDNLTLNSLKSRRDINKEKYGLSEEYVNTLKIPKLLSIKVDRHLSIKQILDEKNNFSICEKIEHLEELVIYMRKKLDLIERIEKKRNLISKNNLIYFDILIYEDIINLN
jgi:hypothetical protein